MKFSISYIVRASQHVGTGVVQRRALVVRLCARPSAHVSPTTFKDFAPTTVPALKKIESKTRYCVPNDADRKADATYRSPAQREKAPVVAREVAAQLDHALRMAHEIAAMHDGASLLRGDKLLYSQKFLRATAGLPPEFTPSPAACATSAI